MSHPHADNAMIESRCPSCGKHYRIPANRLGHRARCTDCRTIFTVAAVVAPVEEETPQALEVAESQDTSFPSPSTLGEGQGEGRAESTATATLPPTSPPPPLTDLGVCIVCQTSPAAGEDLVRCPDCNSLHHKDCWDYNAGCGKYGCPQAPPTDKLQDIEIPASHWGKTEKACPACGQVINAAALRCRACGTTFDAAAPQETREFHSRQMNKAELPKLATQSVWLLVFSVLPCTAPIAAIVGLIWYTGNRANIKKLPGTQSAMALIAVGLAVAQTALIIVVAVIYSLRPAT